ncbi:MAG TPA: hypothetical protein VMV10_31385 [Pirellulales bacterium]|nr:hypothetical protein [Pirellulales bacterium]
MQSDGGPRSAAAASILDAAAEFNRRLAKFAALRTAAAVAAGCRGLSRAVAGCRGRRAATIANAAAKMPIARAKLKGNPDAAATDCRFLGATLP